MFKRRQLLTSLLDRDETHGVVDMGMVVMVPVEMVMVAGENVLEGDVRHAVRYPSQVCQTHTM